MQPPGRSASGQEIATLATGPGAWVVRAATFVRVGTAALAVAVVLLLALRIPLLATFRAALVVLAALELLAFAWRVLSSGSGAAMWLEIVLKLAVLVAAYVVLSGG